LGWRSVRRIESEAEFRKALEELPSCTSDQKGDKKGDPLNLVIVGSPHAVLPAFSRRGWHGTEQTRRASVLKTIRSAVLHRAYLYSPVSPLYVFGRSQDLSGQKARGDVNLRNHLRLWLTPIQFRGQPVWVGQISRDIGVRFIWDIPPTTHKIDPDTDEARDGLVQDLACSQALSKFGYAKGVGAAPRDEPRGNLTGDPNFTDGMRAVMFFGERPTTLGEIEMLDWERPPGVPQSGRLFGWATPTNSVEAITKP
jgi:LssY C-terminus